MQILSIGNSFSSDATRYLHRIAKCGGDDITTVNLYIGGCPLSRHYRNMLSKEKAYTLNFNGQSTGFFVSLDEALLNRDWDIITVQQASRFSIDYDSYQPYLDDLTSYVRMCCPKAKIVVHETWAYEEGSEFLSNLGFENQKQMFDALQAAYCNATYATDAALKIPSGALFQKLFEKGYKFHRDGYHATLGLGRYALGLLWYATLTGKDITDNSFRDFDEPISEEDIKVVKECVMATLK